jgi:hypothetical protein
MILSFLVVALLSVTGIAGVVEDPEARNTQQDTQSPPNCAAGPQDLAKGLGKYFGTATAVGQWGESSYCNLLDNTSIFGSLTPAVGQKVCLSEPGRRHLC